MAIDPMLCACCSQPLEYRRTTHGIVWVCPPCLAGATTLGVIRSVAPREFVNHLWQAARRASTASAKRCPSCTQPLTDLSGAVAELRPSLEVCCRCFLIWLDQPALSALRLDRARTRSIAAEAEALHRIDALVEPLRIEREATAAVALAVANGVADALEAALGP
jgi:hypothetical protein